MNFCQETFTCTGKYDSASMVKDRPYVLCTLKKCIHSVRHMDFFELLRKFCFYTNFNTQRTFSELLAVKQSETYIFPCCQGMAHVLFFIVLSCQPNQLMIIKTLKYRCCNFKVCSTFVNIASFKSRSVQNNYNKKNNEIQHFSHWLMPTCLYSVRQKMYFYLQLIYPHSFIQHPQSCNFS